MEWYLRVIIFYSGEGWIINRGQEEGAAWVPVILLQKNEKNSISFHVHKASVRIISHR